MTISSQLHEIEQSLNSVNCDTINNLRILEDSVRGLIDVVKELTEVLDSKGIEIL